MPNAISQNLETSGTIVALILAGIFTLSGCARILTSIDHVPRNESDVPRISPENLKNRLDNGEPILIVDVRSVKAFKAQHIVGAISVPLKQIESRLNEFPLDQDIVLC